MTSLPKYLVRGNNCNVGRDTVCCFRNPHVCRPGSLHNSSRPSVGLTEPRPLTTAQAQPLRLTAANSTYGCCERSDTFWREPVDDVPPYRRLVQRLLQPFSERISRADVLRATYSTEDGVYRTTCAILRVARGKVCKVRVLGQRLEKTSHKPQEAGLLSLVRKLLPLPDFELACALCTCLGSLEPPSVPPDPRSAAHAPGLLASCRASDCPGDGEAIVADAAAASARWNGKSGCTTGVVHNHVALRQFRCQAKAHLPFFFWYRQNVYGELDGWDATTAQLRARAAATPWEGRRPVAFFRGSLNQAMTPETCLRIKPRDRPTRCELLHVANARPGLIDYSVGPNSSQPFVAWARHKYVLFMEGTEEWADRLKLLLQLGSVVLIQELWCNEYAAMDGANLLRRADPIDCTLSVIDLL